MAINLLNTPAPGSSVLDQINWLINQINAVAFNPASAAITGGTIDGTTIGGTTPAPGTFTTLAATSGTINGSSIATLAGLQTLTNKTLTSPAINGGTIAGAIINSSSIGMTTPAAGAFTTLAATTLDYTAIGSVSPSTGVFTTLQATSSPGASAYALGLTGVPYAGGTATTNFPLLYMNTTGAAAVASFALGGTYLGVNALSSFTGNFQHFFLNGTSKYRVDNNGNIYTAGALTLGSALAASNGGTGLTAVGSSGNILTSNGSIWASSPPAAAAAGALTGTTLASGVINASLNAITPTGGTLSVAGACAINGSVNSYQSVPGGTLLGYITNTAIGLNTYANLQIGTGSANSYLQIFVNDNNGVPNAFIALGSAVTSLTMPSKTVATTQSAGNNSTSLATTAYVDNNPKTCKAWVRFTGATGAVTASWMVSSVTRNATGYYTINLSGGAVNNASYGVVATAGGDNIAVAGVTGGSTTTTSSFNLSVYSNSSSPVLVDCAITTVYIFGN